MKYLPLIILLSIALFSCDTEDEQLTTPDSITEKVDLRSSGSCTCENLQILFEEEPPHPLLPDCCTFHQFVTIPTGCCAVLEVISYDLDGNLIENNGCNSINGFNQVKTWCPEGGPFPTGVYIEYHLNGELCTTRTLTEDCVIRCSDCEISLTENECEITACLNRYCDINSIFAAYWTTPSSTFPQSISGGGAAILPCFSIPVDENGEYCFTIVDEQGCETKKCIDIGCECVNEPMLTAVVTVPPGNSSYCSIDGQYQYASIPECSIEEVTITINGIPNGYTASFALNSMAYTNATYTQTAPNQISLYSGLSNGSGPSPPCALGMSGGVINVVVTITDGACSFVEVFPINYTDCPI